MAKVLVTGGSGFIGTNLVAALRNKFKVLNLDCAEPREREHREHWAKVDLLDAEMVVQALRDFNPHYVIHLAARTDLGGSKIEDYLVNTLGTQNLINAIRFQEGVKKVIFSSSKFIARNGYKVKDQFDHQPHTLYGKSKAIMERQIWQSELECEWLIVRPTSIWGPYFGEPYKSFFEHILRGSYFHIGSSVCNKTYGYVGNSVNQIEALLTSETKQLENRVYYLGDSPSYVVRDWAEEIAGLSGRRIVELPKFVVRAAAYLGDLLALVGISFPMTSFRFWNMTQDGVNDLAEIEKLVGLMPHTRIEGTRHTLDWLERDVLETSSGGINQR